MDIEKPVMKLESNREYSTEEIGSVIETHTFDLFIDSNDPNEIQIVTFAENLKLRLLDKYRKGKFAHRGQDVRKVDCQKEINEEILDIINYHLIDKVNAKNE